MSKRSVKDRSSVQQVKETRTPQNKVAKLRNLENSKELMTIYSSSFRWKKMTASRCKEMSR